VSTIPSSGLVTTTYTLPTKAQNLTVTCTAPGLVSAVFPETAVGGPPNLITAFAGSKQTEPVLTPLPLPLVVTLVDAYWNPLPGIAVTLATAVRVGPLGAPQQPPTLLATPALRTQPPTCPASFT
jgi:hypothetical protein